MAIKWSETKNVFVNLQKSRNGFYYGLESMTSAYIMSYLSEQGMDAHQYVDNDLGSTIEIVDDIITMGEDCAIFYITKENLRLVSTITNLIREEEENTKILWFGEVEKEVLHQCNEVAFDAFVFKNYEKNIQWLLENERTEWKKLAGVVFNERLDIDPEEIELEYVTINEIPSVYKSNILSLQNALHTGLLIGRRIPGTKSEMEFRSIEEIVKDFKLISTSNKETENSVMKLICDDFLCFPQWEVLLEKLIACNEKLQFEISVIPEELTENTLEMLQKFKVTRVLLVLNNEKHIQNIEKNIEILQAYQKEKKMKYSVSIAANLLSTENKMGEFLHRMIVESGLITGGMLYIDHHHSTDCSEKKGNRVCLNEEDHKLADSLEKLNKVQGTEFNGAFYYEIPLLNGLVALKTGNYYRLKGTATKHVIVEEENLNKELYDALKEFTSINSAVYVLNSEKQQEEHPEHTFLEETSAVRTTNDYYDKNIQHAKESNYFLSHLHLVENTEEENKKILHLDNYKREEKIIIRESNFTDPEISKQEETLSVNFVGISSKEDLEKFLEEVDYFKETGKIDRSSLLNKQLVNFCRWSQPGGCLLNYIPRMQIDGQGEIHPCLDCAESLGNIKQYQYEIVKKTYEKKEKEIIERKCTGCPAEKVCSKCVMLPSFLTREEYCNIRREKPHIQEYLLTMTVLNYIYKNSPILRGVDLTETRVINSYSYYLTKDIPFGSDDEYLFKPIIIIYIKDNPILWSPVLSRFYRITGDLVFIVELMLKNITPQNIIPILEEKFNISHKEASQCCRQAYDMLHKYGCIKKHIKF